MIVFNGMLFYFNSEEILNYHLINKTKNEKYLHTQLDF